MKKGLINDFITNGLWRKFELQTLLHIYLTFGYFFRRVKFVVMKQLVFNIQKTFKYTDNKPLYSLLGKWLGKQKCSSCWLGVKDHVTYDTLASSCTQNDEKQPVYL